MAAATETRKFEAEVAQVLHLVTHSLYSHKEIFLRELVSNASDACDKLRFEAIATPALLEDDPEPRIEIEVDRDAGTLAIRDNGIGMTREEVAENIGTIARSGTRRFVESLSGDARKDSRLIGQFGVGFYSAFIVADRVTLTTRRAGAPAAEGVRWSSEGTGEYTLEQVEAPRRGTEVVLHLKPDEREFLEPWRLRELVAKYSDHIGFPIRMRKEAGEDEAAPAEWETVNHAAALWTRPKSELADEDYQSFFRHVAHGTDDALAWTHNRVEGNQSYTTLLYLPSKAPWDASEQLLPAYLRFVRGIVDSDDLPLNVSREILQENRLVAQIRGGIVKRVLDLLDKLAADEPEKYRRFHDEFGSVLKEGLAEDFANRERIAKLLRFASTQSEGPDRTVSLDDYIARMKEGQDAIWYVTAGSHAQARNNPAIEALKARGVEVLLMYDRIDEWMVSYLHAYAGKSLKNAAKGELDLGKLGDSADEAKRKEAEAAAAPVVEKLRQRLGDRVRDVRVSMRLTETPSLLVLGEHDMASHMQRMLKEAGHEVPAAKPILEINPSHALLERFEREADERRSEDLALLLLEQAQIAEGTPLEDPSAYIRRVNSFLVA